MSWTTLPLSLGLARKHHSPTEALPAHHSRRRHLREHSKKSSQTLRQKKMTSTPLPKTRGFTGREGDKTEGFFPPLPFPKPWLLFCEYPSDTCLCLRRLRNFCLSEVVSSAYPQPLHSESNCNQIPSYYPAFSTALT